MEWGKILDVFDKASGYGAELLAFVESSAGPDGDIMDKLQEIERPRRPGKESLSDQVEDLWQKMVEIGFEVGYCVGQMVDLTEPKIQEHISDIKQVIRAKGLLPYLPRERRTP